MEDITKSRSYRLAWDIGGKPETGPTYQPWRAFWPPPPNVTFSTEERAEKPWLGWKRNLDDINVKPWYFWVNEFTGEVDTPCDGGCSACGGEGCVSLPFTICG
jgi:hypothetical protein